jgi:hypothetical protein
VWYPGWQARIDGNLTPLYRANVALRGIVVPPGKHRVVFELVSMTMWAGAAVSLAAVVAIGVLILRPRRPQPAPRSAPEPRSGAV